MGVLTRTSVRRTLLAPHMQNIYLLILITAIGAMLRLYKLGYTSLGNDEVASILGIRFYKLGYPSPGNDDISSLVAAKPGSYRIPHPPLSFVILWLFIETLGTNEFTVRLPSCLFGIATIPLVHFFGKQLFGEKEGLLASFIISLSPWYIKWSQEARMYTELTFFTILALYFFYQASYKERVTSYVLSAIFTTMAFYTHYSGVLIVGIIVFWLISKNFFDNKRGSINYKHLVIFFGAVFALWLPLFFITISQTISFKIGENRLTWGVPIDAYFIRLFGSDIGLVLSAFSIFGALYLILSRDNAGYLLTIYALIPLVTFAVLTFRMSVDTRYVIFTLPAYTLLTAHLSIEIFNKIRKSEIEKSFLSILSKNLDKNKVLAFGFLFGIALSVNNLVTLYYYYGYNDRADWKSACAYVKSMMNPEDLIASTGDKVVYYYLGKIDFNLSIELFEPGVFDEIKNSHERVWLLIRGRMKAIDPDNEFKNWIASHCEIMMEARGITVYLFTPQNK